MTPRLSAHNAPALGRWYYFCGYVSERAGDGERRVSADFRQWVDGNSRPRTRQRERLAAEEQIVVPTLARWCKLAFSF
jgi:hypothetical protein